MSETGEFLGGIVAGYILASVCESFFHRTIGHAAPWLRAALGQMRSLGSPFLNAWYSHGIVHHCLTFKRHHFEQISCTEQEDLLREKLLQKGRRKIVQKDYGLRLGGLSEILVFICPTIPIYLVVCWFGGIWASLGALPFLPLMAMMSELLHPYLHMNYKRACRAAPPLLRPLIASRPFQFLIRYHWLHHRYPSQNFNLLLGGDILLGRYRRASDDDLAKMKAAGLPMPLPASRDALTVAD